MGSEHFEEKKKLVMKSWKYCENRQTVSSNFHSSDAAKMQHPVLYHEDAKRKNTGLIKEESS